MAMDIHGICQKRINDRWVTVPNNLNLFNGFRNRYYFWFLLCLMNDIDINDEAVEDLIKEIPWIDNVAELLESGNGITGPGYFTLEEFIDLENNWRNPDLDLHSMIVRNLKEICGSCDHKDFRIVIAFDN